MYDGRWTAVGRPGLWKTPEQGNVRRQQVVTIQSRQYLRAPAPRSRSACSPRAPTPRCGPQARTRSRVSGPRNIRIAYIEDQTARHRERQAGPIQLIPEPFDAAAAQGEIAAQHVLAICEGSRSRTLEHFAGKFGAGDPSMYALDGKQVQDMVLGLRVKSLLPDPMAVLLTVAQNRFLLNSLRGEGFLNMRLTDQETKEAVGIDPVRQVFTDASSPSPACWSCEPTREFYCGGHHALFLPALLQGSAFWTRVQEGLQLFGVPPENLTAVTGFRLDMVQRPRFTAQLLPRTATTPGTFGFLLGDAANAIHFWPGRGLNSGLASAISLARCLAAAWRGEPLRDADFLRHEAVMAMLQYRHKSRAWRQMVTTDADGNVRAIKDMIAQGIAEGDAGALRPGRRPRGAAGAPGPDPGPAGTPHRRPAGRRHPARPPGAAAGHAGAHAAGERAWDTGNVGGEEVDVEWLLEGSAPDPHPAALPTA